MKILPADFEGQSIRRVYDEDSETWWFSVIDVVQVLTQQADYQTARKYWNKLKERLSKEGSESVTDCHRLKLPAADGKGYLTDVASAETLLRLVQSVPSPKAEPICQIPAVVLIGYSIASSASSFSLTKVVEPGKNGRPPISTWLMLL
jgi:DNA-damage-inducible protein D